MSVPAVGEIKGPRKGRLAHCYESDTPLILPYSTLTSSSSPRTQDRTYAHNSGSSFSSSCLCGSLDSIVGQSVCVSISIRTALQGGLAYSPGEESTRY